jgi:hypothetical protein
MATDVSVVSGGPVMARWQRVWYVDVTNTSTAISTNVVFDLSDGGFSATAGTASNYKLLYRSVNSGSWTIVATASSTAGDQVTFSNVGFTNDGYYTIGTLDATTGTLPVEWLFFNASVADENDVQLSWATATEDDADYFAVERTMDGVLFSEIGTVDASGTSTFTHYYSLVDHELEPGVYYYRLREVDFNGQVHYSVLRSVAIAGGDFTFGNYPNPAGGVFTLTIGDAWIEDRALLTILAADGRIVYAGAVMFSRMEIELPAGLYLVEIRAASGRREVVRQVVR